MKTKSIILSSVLLVVISGIFLMFATPSMTTTPTDSYSTITYHSLPCITHIRDGVVLMEECKHNLLFDTGKNMTKDMLGLGGAVDAVNNISLCNATDGDCGTPLAAGPQDNIEFTSCGLTSATGTFGSMNDAGNWSVWNTFTSSCDGQVVNVTYIGNDSSYFAGLEFTLVTLQTNDQLTVNWTTWIA